MSVPTDWYPVTTEENPDNLSRVRVVVLVPGLKTKTNILKGLVKEPKNAKVDVKFHDWSFDVRAEVEPKSKGKKPEKGAIAIKRLPGQIEPGLCTIDYKPEQVILNLVKKEEDSWAAQLSMSGLEQASDDDDD